MNMDDRKGFLKEHKEQLLFFAMIITALFAVLAGILIWKISLIVIGIILALEIGMAVCLQNVPLWLHFIVMIGQILVGAKAGIGMLMILCAVFYLLTILTQSVWKK